jgi:AraC-like DNA-binding protein
MAKHITPKQKEQAITLRAAGYTLAVISDKAGMSISSLKRLFETYTIKRGELKQAVIDKATSELLNDASTVEIIKREAASLLLDDLAMVKRLRESMVGAMEVLEASDTAEALQVMRAVSAGAVALKSTSETLRKSLGLDKENEVSGDLPELVISVLTEAEIEGIRNHASTLSAGSDDGASDVLDQVEDDVIVEGINEPEAIPT